MAYGHDDSTINIVLVLLLLLFIIIIITVNGEYWRPRVPICRALQDFYKWGPAIGFPFVLMVSLPV